MIIEFIVHIFSNKQGAVASENIHTQLADFLEGLDVEQDEESEINLFDTHEAKAKTYILNWTNKGFLSTPKRLVRV
jgi:hypothetical protein